MIVRIAARVLFRDCAVLRKRPSQVDVTGAGDTVMATYALALASEASFPDAARLANYAGGIVVMKRGTASITREELENSLAGPAE